MIFIVSTPIGNLEDISIRALKTILSSKILVCESITNGRKIVNLLQEKYKYFFREEFILAKKKFIKYCDHSSDETRNYIISLAREQNVVFTSDAGTPLISDPGYKLINEAIKQNIKLESLPGPCAPIQALTLSGMPTDNFIFLGFLPNKISKSILSERLKNIRSTIIFFESPNRIKKTLALLWEIYGNIPCVIAREMTKKFEEIIRAPIGNILDIDVKGEIVVIVDTRNIAQKEMIEIDIHNLAITLLKTNSHKSTTNIIYNMINKSRSKNELYEMIGKLSVNNDKYRQGIRSEISACEYLVSLGYEILEKRKKTPYGEIDIIAKKDNHICFCEVKSSNNIENAMYAISTDQRNRISQAANSFIVENLFSSHITYSFDAIIIDSNTNEIRHIGNAWEYQE